MRKRGIIGLAVMLVLLSAMTFVSVHGLSFGLWEIRPMGAQIKENKLGLDLTGGFYAVYQAQSANVADFNNKLLGTMSIFRTRLDAKGMTEASITQQGSDSIRVEIPSSNSDPSVLSNYLATPAKLEWRDPNGGVILTGADVTSASVGQESGAYVVAFQLSSEGTTKFAAATQKYLNKNIGIYVDDKEISNPSVNSVIAGGSGVIEGSFTKDSATELATQIESGAIPLTLTELEVNTISATLGADVLSKSIKAGIIGTIIVMLFMLAMYRLSGLMANIALGFYIIIIFFCILTMPGVQLTLSGIAGVILSIGMAVDANVIIFERCRDEIRKGRPLETAVESGFKRAFNAIFDSHVTMLIAGFVLMAFGTGSVKGFAYTLAIGAGVSLFSAYFITRFLLRRVVMMNIKHKNWLVRV